jgi:large subunit ribosomal protein L4
VDSIVLGDTPSTKEALAAIIAATAAPATAQVLVVITAGDEVSRRSLRNAPSVHVLEAGQLNTRDVLVSDFVVFTQEALDGFVARMTGSAPAGPGSAEETPAPADEKPAPADVKPASADVKPAPADVKPAPANEKPASADVKPADADEKPADADEKPAKAAPAKPRASRAKPKQEDDRQ